jgi:hypothetical protein
VLAHQGGWDEILLVLGPIGVVVGLLAVVRSRLAEPESGVDASHETHDVTSPRAVNGDDEEPHSR